ncbi:hypothetical protein MCAMS1_02766 [biofilm metagenome]
MSKPYPDYSEADLERVVARDFGCEAVLRVKAILARYGEETGHSEVLRVQMACIKCANGDIVLLEQEINIACCDYRDILAAAEFPNYIQARDLETKRIARKSDWDQLQLWLHRK